MIPQVKVMKAMVIQMASAIRKGKIMVSSFQTNIFTVWVW